MLTTLGFQIAFYGLCGIIIALAAGSIVRRRRRERLLSQRSHEELQRLDRLQLEMHGAVQRRTDTPEPVNAVPRPSAADVRPESLATASLAPAVGTSELNTAASSASAVDAIPIYRGDVAPTTTWQDHTLFGTRTQARWTGSPAIPRVEPHQVPTVDTSDYVFGAATPVLASFLPETDESRRVLARELQQAGNYAPHARENLAAIRFLFMIGSLLLGGVAVLLAPRAAERVLLVGTMVLSGLGWALPPLFVRSRARSRRTEIERAIPDMMDMLNMCVSQGLTVPDALTRISQDLKPVYPALAQELAIVVDQSKVGTLSEALQNFADRIDLPQVDSFASLLTQTERMGTSVSDALTDYSDTMRESLRQRADERANQASFALLFPTVLALMPAVFMFLMGPAVIELSKFTNAGGLRALNDGRASLRDANRQQLRGPGSAVGSGGQQN